MLSFRGRFGMKCCMMSSLTECAVSCILTSKCVIFFVALTLSNLEALGPDSTPDEVHALRQFAKIILMLFQGILMFLLLGAFFHVKSPALREDISPG